MGFGEDAIKDDSQKKGKDSEKQRVLSDPKGKRRKVAAGSLWTTGSAPDSDTRARQPGIAPAEMSAAVGATAHAVRGSVNRSAPASKHLHASKSRKAAGAGDPGPSAKRPNQKQEIVMLRCPERDCGRAFSRKSNLTAHLRMHSGETPYQCPTCLEKFRWKSGVTTHFKHNPSHDNGTTARIGSASVSGARYAGQPMQNEGKKRKMAGEAFSGEGGTQDRNLFRAPAAQAADSGSSSEKEITHRFYSSSSPESVAAAIMVDEMGHVSSGSESGGKGREAQDALPAVSSLAWAGLNGKEINADLAARGRRQDPSHTVVPRNDLNVELPRAPSIASEDSLTRLYRLAHWADPQANAGVDSVPSDAMTAPPRSDSPIAASKSGNSVARSMTSLDIHNLHSESTIRRDFAAAVASLDPALRMSLERKSASLTPGFSIPTASAWPSLMHMSKNSMTSMDWQMWNSDSLLQPHSAYRSDEDSMRSRDLNLAFFSRSEDEVSLRSRDFSMVLEAAARVNQAQQSGLSAPHPGQDGHDASVRAPSVTECGAKSSNGTPPTESGEPEPHLRPDADRMEAMERASPHSERHG
ncbi:Zinc finger protein [Porphyridium purpureum]|uniref:Zinc finger protein n=1 Tax=Porphyridium purpureum TaxID=35688 RepID=A0A5J4ZAK3_PORPP|nr:Zinc finger protein [Porphyridium purpureum]|eukprot:POR8870..scf295_1